MKFTKRVRPRITALLFSFLRRLNMNIGKLIFRLKKNVPLLLTIGTTIGIAATSYFSAKAALEVNKILNETPDEELKSFPTKK